MATSLARPRGSSAFVAIPPDSTTDLLDNSHKPAVATVRWCRALSRVHMSIGRTKRLSPPAVAKLRRCRKNQRISQVPWVSNGSRACAEPNYGVQMSHSRCGRCDVLMDRAWSRFGNTIQTGRQFQENAMSRWTLACAAALLSLVAGSPVAAQSLQKVTAVIPQNSVFVLNWNGAKDAGVFKKHGIDLTVDVRPFGGFLSALPSKQTLATTYSGLNAVGMMNEGLDLAVIGGGLTVIQDVFVL
jgi:hypothetical protein